MWTFDCLNVIAQENYFMNAHGPLDSYGCHIDYGCENVVYQYNYSFNNEGGFVEILGDNINCGYRYNISINDGYRLGLPWSGTKGKTFLYLRIVEAVIIDVQIQGLSYTTIQSL